MIAKHSQCYANAILNVVCDDSIAACAAKTGLGSAVQLDGNKGLFTLKK